MHGNVHVLTQRGRSTGTVSVDFTEVEFIQIKCDIMDEKQFNSGN